MKRWTIRILVLAALVGGGWALRATVLAPEPLRVRVHRVERGPVEATVTNSKAGTIEARRRAELSTGTSGIVAELSVQRGQRVQAGEALLRLEDSSQRAQLVLAERALAVAVEQSERACLAAERSRRELERNRVLADQAIVSVDLLDKMQSAAELAAADCEVSAAEVERARAAVEVARVEHEKTVLRAPFDAIVAEVSVELGEWVTPSIALVQAPELIDAIDPTSLYVSAPMDEVDAAVLAVGLPARVTIDPFPGRAFPGRVARVAPYVLDVEQQNRTLEIEVELEDQAFSATLLPGTSADVEVVLEVREDVLRVPTQALLEGARVLLVEDGRLVERAIEPGLRNWDWTEVNAGLSAGERVVTSLDREGVAAGAEAVVEDDARGAPARP